MTIYPLHQIESAVLRRLLLVAHFPMALFNVAVHAVVATFDKVRELVVSVFNAAVNFVVGIVRHVEALAMSFFNAIVTAVVGTVGVVLGNIKATALDTAAVWRGPKVSLPKVLPSQLTQADIAQLKAQADKQAQELKQPAHTLNMAASPISNVPPPAAP